MHRYVGSVIPICAKNPSIAVLLEINMRCFGDSTKQWPGWLGVNEDPGRMNKRRRISRLRRQCRRIHTTGNNKAVQ